MKHKRGEVVLALCPDSNLRTAKRRPVLVIQADGIHTGLPQSVVAMISSNMARAGHPCRSSVPVTAPLSAAASSGLKIDSVIMADNLCTLADSEIDRSIGIWKDMAAVDAALRATLAL